MPFDITAVNPTALVYALASMIVAGAWFASAQVAAISNLSRRFEEFKREMETRRITTESDGRSRDTVVSSIDIRLTRIEAQLAYLVGMKPDAPRSARPAEQGD